MNNPINELDLLLDPIDELVKRILDCPEKDQSELLTALYAARPEQMVTIALARMVCTCVSNMYTCTGSSTTLQGLQANGATSTKHGLYGNQK